MSGKKKEEWCRDVQPACHRCGNTSDYDMKRMWEADEDIRSLKSLILFGIRGMAAYAYHAMVLGYTNEEVNDFSTVHYLQSERISRWKICFHSCLRQEK